MYSVSEEPNPEYNNPAGFTGFHGRERAGEGRPPIALQQAWINESCTGLHANIGLKQIKTNQMGIRLDRTLTNFERTDAKSTLQATTVASLWPSTSDGVFAYRSGQRVRRQLGSTRYERANLACGTTSMDHVRLHARSAADASHRNLPGGVNKQTFTGGRCRGLRSGRRSPRGLGVMGELGKEYRSVM